MRYFAVRALVLMLSTLAAAPWAQAQKRVALVIGNSAYQHTPQLTNPRHDAEDIAAALKRHGFQVIEGLDLDKPAFERKVRDFATALKGSEAGVFFYAGHGMQVAGQNYLVPIDAKADAAEALEFEMVRVDVVHRIMERQTNTNILILDACRDNPLARNLSRSMGTRSSEVGRGLAAIESGVGTLISFSTQPGNVALDGTGRNSPFAGALAKHVASANDDLSAILISVRNDVMTATQRKQVPWEHSALTGRFYFSPAAQSAGPAKVAPARLSEAAEAWDRAKDATSIALLEAFIARYKDTFYAELARARIDELKRQQTAAAAPPKVPATPKAAEPAVTAPLPAGTQPFTLASPLTLRIQDTFPAADTSSRDPLKAVAGNLAALSDGKLKIVLMEAGTVVPAFQVLDAVSSGLLDAAWTSPGYWLGRSKAFGIFAGTVPGGLDAAAFVRWMEGEGSAELNRLVGEFTQRRVRSLPCAVIGPGGDWFKKPIARIDDFKGLKFRSIGLPAEVGKEIGASVAILPGGEIIPALDKGVIDGTDWSNPESAIALGLPNAAKFLYYPSWSRPAHLFELLVGEGVWTRLGRDAQQGLEASCRQNLHRSLAKISAAEKQALAALRNRGVTVQPYPEAVLESARQASQRVLDRLAKDDANFARVLASYNKHR